MPLLGAFDTGDVETTCILYLVPVAVVAGIIAVTLVYVLARPLTDPTVTGDVKLPVASLS